jgi:hypothetical protein
MAGQVGPVQSIMTGGFGFTLNDDPRRTQCLTLVYETQEEAAAARKLVAEAFAKAKSATAPDSR